MGKIDVTLDDNWNIIAVSNYMYHLPIPFKTFTLSTISTQITFPYVTPEYYLNQSATDILEILQRTTPFEPLL